MLSDQIIRTGLKFLGTPYLFNAPSYWTNQFDCSSFMQYIFGVNGVALPRNARQQFQVGIPIRFADICKGDLLFFTTKARMHLLGRSKVGHVGVYIGNNRILHTYREAEKVTVSEINPYWRKAFVGARRVVQKDAVFYY